MQKAKLSVQLGPLHTFFGQVHNDYTCNTLDEVTHEIVMERVMGASGSGSKVIDNNTGRTALKTQVQGAGTASSTKSTGKKTDEVTVDDEVGQAIKQVRSGGATWVAAEYASGDKPHVILKGSGTGDVSELRDQLEEDNVCYVLVRKIEQIDATEAVKFVFIRWVGSKIPTMQRAKLSSHAGTITQYFSPHHTTLDSPDLSEVTDENVMAAIRKASGTYEHVLEKPRGAPKSSSSSQSAPRSGGGGGGGGGAAVKTHGVAPTVEAIINFEDEAGIKAAIKAVRADSDPTTWCLITYTAEKSKTLKLHATGTGNMDDLKGHLSDKIVAYGLYRTTDKVDDSVTVKFVWIDWRGVNIHRMQKAVLATHSGAVKELLQPYHVDINASTEEDLTDDHVLEKIRAAAGTAVHVRG